MSSPLDQVQTEIQRACEKSGRDIQDVRLIAVSKTWPAEKLNPLIDQGQLAFGENKLQELEVKAPALPSRLEWHFIGGLQRNKVRKILQHASVIHSVDSVKLLNAIDRIAGEEGKRPEIFLQANLEEEASKGGFRPSEISSVVEHAKSLENIDPIGLMSIPKFYDNPEDVRPAFRHLRQLRDTIAEETGHFLPNLSMGMSHDYPIAIEEGATHIRVGSALFGARQAK